MLEHTNERVPLAWRDYAAFLAFMATHGLSASTVWAIARQLLRETTGRFGWQRVTLLDRLQWDVFRFYYRKLRPDLSTFFINSVAHLQHTHWRNLEPERFQVQPTPEEQAEYRDAVLYGYQENDRLLGRFLALAGDDATLVFCTALSQQPCLAYEDMGAKRFYRPYKFEDLVAFAGVTTSYTCSPVMSEEFHLYFEDEASASDAEQRLRGLRVADETALYVDRTGTEIYSGCQIFHELPAEAPLDRIRLGPPHGVLRRLLPGGFAQERHSPPGRSALDPASGSPPRRAHRKGPAGLGCADPAPPAGGRGARQHAGRAPALVRRR